MNILFYQFGINPLKGGVQRVSYNIAEQLKLFGYKVYVVYKDNDTFTENLKNAFEDCLKINSLDDSTFTELVKFSRTYKINIIINQCGFSILDTKFLSRLKNECQIRLYSFIHISPTGSRDVLQFRDFRFPKLVLRSLAKEFIFIFYQADKWKYKRIYKLSDKVVLLSKSFISDFKLIIDNNDENHKITAISNSITYPLQDESVLQKKEKILLVVARMGETSKKISRVLDCWKILNAELEEWELILVGAGSDLQAYKDIARRNNLPRITFTGMADPSPYYLRASIFLMTSATEGFGMTILEAQQYGVVPIVMDSYKSVRDIISDGENGFITPNKNLSDFASKILLLAKNNELRISLAKNALHLVQRFSEKQILTLWNNLLSNERTYL